MDFQGGNCYFAFCPLTSSSFPSLYPLVALSFSLAHFLFLIYPCVCLSLTSTITPPASHLHTSLDSTFSFLSLFHRFLLGKERENLSVWPVIICNILLFCLWKKLSKYHLTVLATRQGSWRFLLKYWAQLLILTQITNRRLWCETAAQLWLRIIQRFRTSNWFHPQWRLEKKKSDCCKHKIFSHCWHIFHTFFSARKKLKTFELTKKK